MKRARYVMFLSLLAVLASCAARNQPPQTLEQKASLVAVEMMQAATRMEQRYSRLWEQYSQCGASSCNAALELLSEEVRPKIEQLGELADTYAESVIVWRKLPEAAAPDDPELRRAYMRQQVQIISGLLTGIAELLQEGQEDGKP